MLTFNMSQIDVFQKQEQKITDLRKSNRSLRSLLYFLMLVLLLLMAYVVYIEVSDPPFGKWRSIMENKAQMEQYNEYLLVRIDSIARANDLLMENSPLYTGVFFEVQIGAFKNFDLDRYQDALENLRYYRQDSLKKYVIGKFRNYPTAKAFQKDIVRMGVKDAFVVGKINGNRVEISAAIRAAKEQKW